MKPIIYILWDASHIWGLMVLHTLQSLGLPHRLVTAHDITHGLLLRKPPALLLVPGGTASIKARALGVKGRAAICDYVQAGGKYFGFCGGAGLGLSSKDGLGLCPWKRATYENRLQHLVSGHVISHLSEHALVPKALGKSASLPVWWPGFFEPQDGQDVEILARYSQADSDLYLADIKLSELSEHILTQWQDVYGVDMGVNFLQNHPCVISGKYGEGRYVLSYAHLETPNSPHANTFMLHILKMLANIEGEQSLSATWDLDNLPVHWENTPDTKAIFEAHMRMQEIIKLGHEHGLLFSRNSWLQGSCTGIPGGALNNLYTSFSTALSLKPNEEALSFWQEKSATFASNLQVFWQGVEGYLLAERLAKTLAGQLPEVINKRMLTEQRHMLFGKPMHAGGLYQELLDVSDELVYLMSAH